MRPYLHSGANVTYTRLAAASTEIRVSTIMRRCSRRLHRFIILSSDFGRSIDRLTEAALSGDIPGRACGHLSSQALLRRQRPLGQGGDVDAEIDKGRTDIGAVLSDQGSLCWATMASQLFISSQSPYVFYTNYVRTLKSGGRRILLLGFVLYLYGLSSFGSFSLFSVFS